MNWYEDFDEDEDVYSDKDQTLIDNDEISPSECGFMSGYNNS